MSQNKLTVLFITWTDIERVESAIAMGETLVGADGGHRAVIFTDYKLRDKLYAKHPTINWIVTDISDDESEEPDTETNSYYGAGLSTGVQQVLTQRDNNMDPIVERALVDIRPDVIVVDSRLDLPSVARSGVPWIVVNTSQPLSPTRLRYGKAYALGSLFLAVLLANKTTMVSNEQHNRRYRYVSAITDRTLIYARDLFYRDPGMIFSLLRNLRHLTIRPADVWLCGYPKSGNTWLSEIVSLIMADGVVDRVSGEDLEDRVFHFCKPRDDYMGWLESRPEPRMKMLSSNKSYT
ncbi:unnamed protein product [Medioppia subpectinata]|uniref:Sulfotransferase domain-containing protein n=1 Tax=Medioppia subpectinata TaxID=1979941 RepID=A0A7R9KPA5_9ACAR|nr:unnamed protein product [Medioppia subpectinata]CAG2106988.1 unnamed protein product [Medioppia subpectinata]